MYQGNRLSQERVISYTQLIMGETLAQRTIDKLGLDMSAEELRANVKASAKPDTVLIDVDVLDKSSVRARDIANALSDEFVAMVRELETPEDGSRPDARVVVEQRASIPEETGISEHLTLNLLAGIALGATIRRSVLPFFVASSTTLSRTVMPLKTSRVSDSSEAFRSTKSAAANLRYPSEAITRQ